MSQNPQLLSKGFLLKFTVILGLLVGLQQQGVTGGKRLDHPEEPVVSAFNPADYTIAFVTDDENDSLQIEWLEERGFTVSTWWPANIESVTHAEIAQLNDSDLVILGRSPGSFNYLEMKDILHDIWMPMINNQMWSVRNNRMNWFNSGTADHINDTPEIYSVHVHNPSDSIFAGITLAPGDSLDYSIAPHDFLFIVDTTLSNSNAEVVAANSNLVAIARFEPAVEFYPGSGDRPLGYRTYFGFGNDVTTNADGNQIINYFPLTENAKAVYYEEIKRLIRLGDSGERPVLSSDASLSDLMIDGTTVNDFSSEVYSYTKTLPRGTTAVPVVSATATSEPATVEITQAPDVTMSDATIVVTAEDGTTQTYTITFNVEESTGAYDILFVGLTTSEADLITRDSLLAWGYNVNLINGADYVNEDHSNYDMVYISESISSNNATPYGTAGFPIDCFLAEPYALNKPDIELGTVTETAQSAIIENMIIVDDTHDITRNVYLSGQEVEIYDDSDPAWPDHVFQYEIDLAHPDYPSGASFTELGKPADNGTEDPAWNDLPSWAVIHGGTGPLPSGTEIIVHAFHQGISIVGTSDYWKQVKSSVKYLLNDTIQSPDPEPEPSTDAALSEILVDGSSLSGFEPGKFEYIIHLPSGTTTIPTIAATSNDPNATVTIIPANDLSDVTTIDITAEDSTTTATYTVRFNVLLEDITILFVGTLDHFDDLLLLDSLQSWGYNVEFIDGPNHSVDHYTGDLYDLVYISETISSSNAIPYGEAGFKIPCFFSESFALNKSFIELGGLSGTEQSDVITSMVMENVSHEILHGEYTEGQVASIYDDDLEGLTFPVYQYEFYLNEDVKYTTLGRPDLSGLNDSSGWSGNPSFVLIEDFSANVNDIEIVVHGFGQGVATKGTEDYWKQVRISVQYLLSDTLSAEPEEPSTDADLLSITISGDTIEGFSPSTLNYLVELPFGTIDVPGMEVTLSDTIADVEIIDATGIPGTTYIIVTAEDGVTKQVYEVYFTITDLKAIVLSGIAVDGISLSGFSPSVMSYQVVLPEGTENVPVVTATPVDTSFVVKITDADAIPGTTIIMVSTADGANSETYEIAFTMEKTVLASGQLSSGLKLYPNPVQSKLTIESARKLSKVELFSITGKRMYSTELRDAQQSQLDLSDLPKGVYHVRITFIDNSFTSYRVVK